jgi:23S rRNA (guanosine2251-2'-O)-methyltransferase
VFWEEVGSDTLESLSKGLRHQGVIAITGDYPYVGEDELLAHAGPAPLVMALDEVTDPRNLGAVIRSGVAFGVDAFVVPKHRAASVTPAAVRVATGATEHARIARVTNLARTLRTLGDEGLQRVGLTGFGSVPEGGPDVVPLAEVPAAPAGRVLVLGSEGKGLRRLVREACDVLAAIPLRGPVESLNASVAAGIALYETRRQPAGET